MLNILSSAHTGGIRLYFLNIQYFRENDCKLATLKSYLSQILIL